MKGPAFTLSGTVITETKTGSTGRVVTSLGMAQRVVPFGAIAINKISTSYTVKELDYKGKPGKEQVLYARMTNWYFYNHIATVSDQEVIIPPSATPRPKL